MIKRNDSDKLFVAAQAAAKAAKVAKSEKQAKKVGTALMRAFGLNMDNRDELAEMVQKVEKAAKVRDAAVLALFREVDNVDDSPISIYTALKVQWVQFGRLGANRLNVPNFAEWVKTA